MTFADIISGYVELQQKFLREQEREAGRTIPAIQKRGETMSDDLTKKSETPIVVDGFDGFSDRTEGEDPRRTGALNGTIRVRFTNDAKYVRTDTEQQMPPEKEYVGVNLGRACVKFVHGKLEDTRTLEAKEAFPDIKRLNEEAPKSEWSEGPDGKMHGPYTNQYILFFLDPTLMDRFSFPTSTIGGGMAMRALADRTSLMREVRGDRVYPVLTLGDIFMNTKYGGRQRPHFIVKRFITLGPPKALPTSTEPIKPLSAGDIGRTVEEPTTVERMKDEIKF
jgi:hypothetical protein